MSFFALLVMRYASKSGHKTLGHHFNEIDHAPSPGAGKIGIGSKRMRHAASLSTSTLLRLRLVFRTLHRGFCLLRTEQGLYGLTAQLSGLRDGFNGYGLTRIGSEPC
jgi:hypothetical protein